jgi:hypothetical protein
VKLFHAIQDVYLSPDVTIAWQGRLRKDEVWSMKCEVWSVKCEVWSMK